MIIESRKVQIGNREVDLFIARHERAKNIKVSCDKDGLWVRLTLPKRASIKTGMTFFEKSKDWLAKHLPAPTVIHEFKHGDAFPYLGRLYKINQTQSKNFLTKSYFIDDVLHVRGDDVHRTTVDWLQQRAGEKLYEISKQMAAKLGVTINRITIKEITSRWGSCSDRKNLNYSWRVIMAPEHIVEYLCAHEVSHLLEMNHSDKFWAHVASLCPNHQSARKWLRIEGRELFKYSGI